MKIIKWIIRSSLYIGVAVVTTLGLSRLIVELISASRIHALDDAPTGNVAIVFGAGLSRNGQPSPVLRDRVQTAVTLYQQGKVKKLLMSGDNRFVEYNEPGAMKNYAVELGVPEQDIVLDYAGRRTYDTCYRAKAIFGLKEVLLVTQRFHLARAIFTCQGLGVDAQGVSADRRTYLRRSQLVWNVRETFATTVAIWEVLVSKPLPVLGDPEPIFTAQTPVK